MYRVMVGRTWGSANEVWTTPVTASVTAAVVLYDADVHANEDVWVLDVSGVELYYCADEAAAHVGHDARMMAVQEPCYTALLPTVMNVANQSISLTPTYKIYYEDGTMVTHDTTRLPHDQLVECRVAVPYMRKHVDRVVECGCCHQLFGREKLREFVTHLLPVMTRESGVVDMRVVDRMVDELGE